MCAVPAKLVVTLYHIDLLHLLPLPPHHATATQILIEGGGLAVHRESLLKVGGVNKAFTDTSVLGEAYTKSAIAKRPDGAKKKGYFR